MASPIFQKLFVLVLGTPADTTLATALETRVSHEGWGSLIADVNGYLNAQAQVHGGANLIQQMAMNGLGLELSDQDAAAIYAGVSSGATTWADLLAYVILELEGDLGQTLSNRAEAAGAFTDALVEQIKGNLYEWNGGPNLNNAAHNLLQSIGADELTFEQGMASLVELVNNLSAEGLGGVVSDGRLSGATVFIDANGNGLLDDGEEIGTTDAAGEYDVPTDAPAGTLMMSGGTDILAVSSFLSVLQAPAGATVITPFTSLAEALLDIDAEETALGASATATSALGLPPFNVLNYDPIVVLADPEATPEELEQALAIERVAIQLMNLVNQLTVALMDGGMEQGEAAQAAWAAIAEAAANGTLDLTDQDAIEALFDDAGAGDHAGDMAEVVAALNQAAEDADNIVDLAKVAVVSSDAAEDLRDALDEGGGLDDWVDEYTGGDLDDAIEEADPGFLLPGVPVDGEGSPNLPPTGASGAVTVDEDASYTFDADDFGYSDANGDEMAAVRIDSLPSAGTLMLDGEAVTAGQVVAAADVGLLTFTPAENGNGAGYASFTFSVQDAQGAFDSSPRTLTIDVTAVNDEPTGDVSVVGMTMIGNKIFAQEALADIEGVGEIRYEWFADGESLGKFGSSLTLTDRELGKMITAQASYTDGGGTLELVMSAPVGPVGTPNNEAVGNVTISGDPTQNETLTASHDVTDEDGMGEISWQWFADGIAIEGATGEDYVLTQDEVGKDITVELRFTDLEGHDEAVPSDEVGPVINVNDAPTLTAVVDGSTDEDDPFYFSYGGLLGASDAEDIDGDPIAFRVEWVGEDGTLEMWDGDSWEAVQAGDFIDGEDELRWTPDANLNGEDFDAFSIEAYDGELFSGSDVMVRIDVTPVNDAPTLTDVIAFKSTDEDTSVEITYAELALAADDGDVEGDPISFMIMDPGTGTLEEWTGEDWVAATVDTVLSAGEKLRWTPPANVNGSDVDAFTIRAFDGELLSSTDVLVEIQVYPVNDVPTLTTVETLTGGSEDDKFYFTGEDLLEASDAFDADGDAISFKIINDGEDSSLQMWDGDSWEPAPAGTFFNAASQMRWTPPPEANGDDYPAFTVTVADVGSESSNPVQVYIDIAPGQAPVLSDANPVLTSVAETVGVAAPTAPTNGSTTGATQVSTLASESGIANVTDADDNVIGIAITAFNASAQGKLWYSTDAGATWTELVAASATSARLLDNDDWVYFKPNAGVAAGSISSVFTFKAWDLSGGTSGATANTNFGDSWSTATDTVAVTITAAPGGNVGNSGTFGDGFDDLYYGGSGNDTITSGTGSDTLYGGGGDDVINAGNDGDVVYGGSGNDSITGGNHDDTIRGGEGNDTINGGNQTDLIQFEATAALNGIDTITIALTGNEDILALPNVMVTGGAESGGGAFAGAITPFTSGSTGNPDVNGKVAIYQGSALGDVETPAQVAALFGTGTVMQLGANGKAILITGTAGDSDAYMWYIVNDGTATVTAAEVTQVAVLITGSGVDSFETGNFTFYTA